MYTGQPKIIFRFKTCTKSPDSTLGSKTVQWITQIQIQPQKLWTEQLRFVHLWPQKPRDTNYHFKKQYLNKSNYKASLQICNPYVSALLDVTQLWLEVSPRRFGTDYRPHLQGSSSPRLGLLEDRSNRLSWSVGDSTSNQEERRNGGSLQSRIVIAISQGRKFVQLNETYAENQRYLFILYLLFMNTINGRLPHFL